MAASRQPLLDVRDLKARLWTAQGPVRAVDGVSFAIAPGETFSLLGESGCGKSMTALALMRLLPDGGELAGGAVTLAGRELRALTEAQMREVRGGSMAMIFQEPATSLNPVFTVGQQIGEVLAQHAGLAGAAARTRATELLAAVGISDPDRRLDDYPFRLSGGMKQRAMIAMALAGEPQLLIADEPTTALDVTIQAQVLDLLAKIQAERGMGMLLITHDLGVVARMAHRVGVMYAGHLVETGSREAFFARPLHPYSRKLFAALPGAALRGRRLDTIPGTVPPLTREFRACRFADRCEHAQERCRVEAPGWYDAGQGQRVRCHLYAPNPLPPRPLPRPEAEAEQAVAKAPGPLLEVRGLEVHFPIRKGLLKRITGHVRAVDGVDLDVPQGHTLALVGESGCGKTTTGKAILRLEEPTGGTVRFAGEDLSGAQGDALRRLRRELQMVFQDPFASLNPRLRVGEIIEEGIIALGLEADPARRRERVEGLLQRVGLDPAMAQRFPHEFSGGQRQRIAIARALAVSPKLIVCDEPTSALDVSVQAQILNLLRGLQRELGLSYLFITHNIAVVDYLAHEVAVMYLGRIVERGTVEEVLRSPRHPYTVALLQAVPKVDGPAKGTGAAAGTDLPSPINPPAGCHFHPRCPQAAAQCREAYPEERALSETRVVRCHLVEG